ncbi:hypothetical protein [Vreelandella sp. V005]|uniref:hypothetical protein n=1 Tax=Vreelandella sp. V005 TaxID=3459608 RepID=UPI0040447105
MAEKSEEERINDARAKKAGKQRPFPACPFLEALDLAKSLLEYGSGQPVRRISLFDHIGKSPESGTSRQWITNASKYGLTKGSYKAEHLELTPEGAKAVDEELSERERTKAKVGLAIENIDTFNQLYEKFVGNKLPARAAMVDSARDIGVPEKFLEEAVDTFIVNLRDLGLLQTLSGAERIVTVEHLLDTLPSGTPRQATPTSHPHSPSNLVTLEHASFENTCFYITPIGEDGSEQRKHSDLFLGSIIEPALEQFQLKVVRADNIDKPGFITRQIIDYLLRSRLVIADLSFHNPNVFYELAIRHAARLPVVQIIRAAERIPFDLNQVRTIKIDTTDIYSLVPRIATYQSEISNQVRRALEDPDSVDNPVSFFYPNFVARIDG